MKFFTSIWNGVEWIGKEIEKAFVRLPRLIKLADDVEEDIPTIVPELTSLIQDSADLTAATVKDGGIFVAAFGNLTAAIAAAIASKGINVTEDGAVLAALESFARDFNAANVSDIMAAWGKLTVDTQTFGSTIKAALAQLDTDAHGDSTASPVTSPAPSVTLGTVQVTNTIAVEANLTPAASHNFQSDQS